MKGLENKTGLGSGTDTAFELYVEALRGYPGLAIVAMRKNALKRVMRRDGATEADIEAQMNCARQVALEPDEDD